MYTSSTFSALLSLKGMNIHLTLRVLLVAFVLALALESVDGNVIPTYNDCLNACKKGRDGVKTFCQSINNIPQSLKDTCSTVSKIVLAPLFSLACKGLCFDYKLQLPLLSLIG
ncbi:unnamed protein product [Darwinula stevensoni]|uniref:Uncharacterized protein n=1 Tax=Darwinula stevensoni TaxID=69355 RepID=A0A7R9FPM5_9CRUS|nr:unnamed protein product [Darwinula stevensoni]CAG0898133.1 unnamed protein product [Darwinula stevensoni]